MCNYRNVEKSGFGPYVYVRVSVYLSVLLAVGLALLANSRGRKCKPIEMKL